MRHATATVMMCSLISFVLVGCGAAEFGGVGANQKTSQQVGNEAGGVIGQGGADDANGMINGGDADDANGALPPMSADEAAGLITSLLEDPANGSLEDIVDNQLDSIRCYISHSGGHGIDMCMQDTTPVQALSARAARGTFIEIKGNQLCVPPAVLLANLDLFKTAVTGECK